MHFRMMAFKLGKLLKKHYTHNEEEESIMKQSNQPQDEAEIRNKLDEDGDSLMEKKKILSGVDIEPQADAWAAKPSPVAFDEADTTSKK